MSHSMEEELRNIPIDLPENIYNPTNRYEYDHLELSLSVYGLEDLLPKFKWVERDYRSKLMQ